MQEYGVILMFSDQRGIWGQSQLRYRILSLSYLDMAYGMSWIRCIKVNH
jgi:hypothetical protein